MEDLIGAYVEITSLECVAGYGEFNPIHCIFFPTDDEMEDNLSSAYELHIGYELVSTPTGDGTFDVEYVGKENTVLLDGKSLQIGDKFLFVFGKGLVDEKLVDWILSHSKPVDYPNKYSRLQYNGKYVRNVNGKGIRKVNDKNILPYYNTFFDNSIAITEYIGETGEQTIDLIMQAVEPVDLYVNDTLVGTIPILSGAGTSNMSFTYSFVQGQQYEFKFVGGKFAWGLFSMSVEYIDITNYSSNLFNVLELVNGKNCIPSTFITPSLVAETRMNINLLNNMFIKMLLGSVLYADGTNVGVPECVKILYNWITNQSAGKSIIPRNVIVFWTSATVLPSEIQFNHLENDILFLDISSKAKNAAAVTIYHYGNPTVLNYDWASKNYTPTFVDLREQQ